MKTLMIMAGGTGGHVIPALAVAHQLRERGVNIIWMGTRNGIEFDLVPKAGFELKLINVKGVRGSNLVRKIITPFILLRAAFQAMRLILSVKADAMLGMGGFVSGPGGLMGRLLRKPLILHEQNALAGTTNKFLAPFANRVLTGFSDIKGLQQGEYIGNPVKPTINAIPAPASRISKNTAQLKVMVVGGSQGALVFNQKLPRLMHQWQDQLGDKTKLLIQHQCGAGNFALVEHYYAEHSTKAEIVEFIGNMAKVYEWSDIVICRAGAMTVAEIAAAGALALFVPYPHAIDDHQFYNAKAMAQNGAAFCLRQEVFERGEWLAMLSELALDRKRLILMAEKARAFAKPNATNRLADVCMEVLNA